MSCPHWYDYSTDTIAFLEGRSGDGAKQFDEAMQTATDIAAKYGVLFPEHDLLISHMTVSFYFQKFLIFFFNSKNVGVFEITERIFRRRE